MSRIHLNKLVSEKKNTKYGISDAREFIKPWELFVIWRKLKVSDFHVNYTRLLITRNFLTTDFLKYRKFGKKSNL